MLLPEHLNNDNGDFKVILMFTSLVLTEKLLGELGKEDPIKLLLSVCPSARPSVRNFSDNGPLFF